MMAGEYAVLEPHNELLVMAVNRYVYATLQFTETNTVTLENFQMMNRPWTFAHHRLQIVSDDSRKNYVERAMEVSLIYLQEHDISIRPFSLTINSELDDEQSGRKYGLGSSAAVTTAAISVILQAFAPTLATKEVIFKLAAITHINIQGNGSGADIAASTYGGVLAYKSFQAHWLVKAYANSNSLTTLLNRQWDYLQIEPLTFPSAQLKLCVGWTGKPASTGKLVDKILRLKQTNKKAYDNFLTESKLAVTHIKTAIQTNDTDLFFQGIEQNRQTLATLGRLSTATIETDRLFDLAEHARQVGGVGKLSGAGGGDCGIAFVLTIEQAKKLQEKWQQGNIQPLHLMIEEKGITFDKK